MGEIKVERKRGNGWIWIAGLLLVALFGWLLMDMLDDDEAGIAAAPVVAPVVAPAVPAPAFPARGVPVLVVDPAVPAPAVAAYVAHVRAGEDRMGSDHLYTAEGITRMATALRELVQAHRELTPQAQARAAEFYTVAAALVVSPDTLKAHADWVQQAAVAATDVLEGLAAEVEGPVPELREQVDQVRAAAGALNAQRDLLSQEQQVRDFFREAADAMAMLLAPRP